jgi:hypothetical protein
VLTAVIKGHSWMTQILGDMRGLVY